MTARPVDATGHAGVLGHDPAPVPGSEYRVGRGNATGTPAHPGNASDYPAEAVCEVEGCSRVLRREAIREPWRHTGRLAGQAPDD